MSAIPRMIAKRVRHMFGRETWLAGVFTVALALSAACGGASLLRGGAVVPPEDIDFARQYLSLFASRSFPAIQMGIDPSLNDPQIRQKLMQMASVFPREAPTAVRVVLAHAAGSGDTRVSNLSFQYEYPNRWLRADVVVGRRGEARVVRGVQIQPLKEPLERTHAISLSGKSARHYAALVVSVLVIGFVLYTFGLALRTPMPGQRWAWAAFTLVGVVPAMFNWTSGGVSFNPMGIQLLGSWFTRSSPFAPLVLTTSIPVGAIVFMIQRREWLRRPPEERGEDDLEEASSADAGDR